MARPHAKPGEVVDVGLFGPSLGSAETTTLVKAKDIEVIRLIVPAGKENLRTQGQGRNHPALP